jgi:propanol-preferring alcohol dehydrogenase
MRPLTIQGSYVGTVEELRELVELVKETHMSAIPVKKLPIRRSIPHLET